MYGRDLKSIFYRKDNAEDNSYVNVPVADKTVGECKESTRDALHILFSHHILECRHDKCEKKNNDRYAENSKDNRIHHRTLDLVVELGFLCIVVFKSL